MHADGMIAATEKKGLWTSSAEEIVNEQI